MREIGKELNRVRESERERVRESVSLLSRIFEVSCGIYVERVHYELYNGGKH